MTLLRYYLDVVVNGCSAQARERGNLRQGRCRLALVCLTDIQSSLNDARVFLFGSHWKSFPRATISPMEIHRLTVDETTRLLFSAAHRRRRSFVVLDSVADGTVFLFSTLDPESVPSECHTADFNGVK